MGGEFPVMGGIRVEQYRELQGYSSPGQGGVGEGGSVHPAPPTQPAVLSLSFAPYRSWVFLSVTHTRLCVTSSASSWPGVGLGSARDSPPPHRPGTWGRGAHVPGAKPLVLVRALLDLTLHSHQGQLRAENPGLPASLAWVTPMGVFPPQRTFPLLDYAGSCPPST